MSWQPKYKVGDVVCGVLPSITKTAHDFAFGAKGIVSSVDNDGYYRVKLTKIFFDEYFSYKISVGDVLTLHFTSVEGADKKLEIVLNDKEKVVFT